MGRFRGLPTPETGRLAFVTSGSLDRLKEGLVPSFFLSELAVNRAEQVFESVAVRHNVFYHI